MGTTDGERLKIMVKVCLLHNSNTLHADYNLPEVYGGTRALSIYMSTVWSFMCTMSIH